jgi:hypothetical protein
MFFLSWAAASTELSSSNSSSAAVSNQVGQTDTHLTIVGFIGAAFLLKLALGANDVVVLLPFMSTAADARAKFLVALQYIFAMFGIVGSAVGIALAFKAVASAVTHINPDGKKHAEQWLSISSGVVLLLYSVYIWRAESSESADAEPGERSALVGTGPSSDSANPTPSTECSGSANAESAEETMRSIGSRLPNLIVLALLSGADDFLVYLAMANGEMPVVSILCGVGLGCIVISTGCALITEIKVVSHFISKIPAWLVVALLGVYIIVSSFLT